MVGSHPSVQIVVYQGVIVSSAALDESSIPIAQSDAIFHLIALICIIIKHENMWTAHWGVHTKHTLVSDVDDPV